MLEIMELSSLREIELTILAIFLYCKDYMLEKLSVCELVIYIYETLA